MSEHADIRPRSERVDTEEQRPGLTEATADVGNTSDLEDAARLKDERTRRATDERSDLPDRAFDRITPQV